MTKSPKRASTGGRDLVFDAYERIRALIQTGKLAIGERVTEIGLASVLGMSRTPVHEAIAKLETDGLLTNEPRRGLIVTDLDHQQIVELYFMREVLEGAAARLTAQAASEIELATFAGLVEAEADALDDVPRMSEINRNFRHLLALSSHNRYLLRSLNQLSITMSLLPTLIGENGRAAVLHQQHREITEALLRRDGAAAESLVKAHVRSSQQHRMGIMLRAHSRTGLTG
jgi:DNA-binding GntR family transcriptional regulator